MGRLEISKQETYCRKEETSASKAAKRPDRTGSCDYRHGVVMNRVLDGQDQDQEVLNSNIPEEELQVKGLKVDLYPHQIRAVKLLPEEDRAYKDERWHIIEEFDRDDSITVLLASFGSASVGLNLTMASRVIFLDPWWNPVVHDQACDGSIESAKSVMLTFPKSITKIPGRTTFTTSWAGRKSCRNGSASQPRTHIE
ncbi:hypothetical protein Cantr_07303 [Candida viswanathii]|uniref:Helicase C-terminal domain-containing protein n=1 Tax=Candida viswanathii TaxID=5486 RepID=A0A367XZ53_9ASCO|nr:hypothetical protein Cantr_07303 [Candida viswanathii]